MVVTTKENIDYELNLKFIDDVRKRLNSGIKIIPRNEDYSSYIFREEDENVLLSISNV